MKTKREKSEVKVPRVPRAPNFTVREKEILVDLVTEEKHRLENNKTDALSAQEKDQAWQELAIKFNSSAGVNRRTAINLRIAYGNFRRKTKKTVADDKVRTYKTGGGNTPSKITTNDEKILALLGPRITPLVNRFDSDADYNGDDDQTQGSVLNASSDLAVFPEASVLDTIEEDELLDLSDVEVETSSSLVAKPSSLVSLNPAVSSGPSTNPNDKALVKKPWKTCWVNRRRPTLEQREKENGKKTSTQEVVDLAKSKKNYYNRLLGMAEEEHEAKLKMLRSKTTYYERKTAFKPKSVVHIFNNFMNLL